MTREIDAIDVFLDQKRVGHLNGVNGGSAQGKQVKLDYHFGTFDELDERCGGECSEERVFPLKTRNFRVPDEKRHGIDTVAFSALMARSVPPYATEVRLAGEAATKFFWSVVALATFEEYEWLFDHPDFVPIDGPLDFDLAMSSAHARISPITKPTATFSDKEIRDKTALTEALWSLGASAWLNNPLYKVTGS